MRDAPAANMNRQFSAVSESMLADVLGMLTELKSKVDMLAVPVDQSTKVKTDSARVAAPGPTINFVDQAKASAEDVEEQKETKSECESDYKDDFESTYKNSESGG